MIVFLYTAYFVVGLFLAHNHSKKIDEEEKYYEIDKSIASITLAVIVLLWPLYLIYKIFKHGTNSKR